MHIHESKYAVLTKKINHIIYELLVKTHADMVYVGPMQEKITLTEKLCEFADLITLNKEDIDDIKEEYDRIVGGAPADFCTFKEVWDYVNIEGDPKSKVMQLINSKVDKEEGKGLSTNDFTDLLRLKLENDYTAEELSEKFDIIFDDINGLQVSLNDLIADYNEFKAKPNAYTDVEMPAGTKDGDFWFRIVSTDEG